MPAIVVRAGAVFLSVAALVSGQTVDEDNRLSPDERLVEFTAVKIAAEQGRTSLALEILEGLGQEAGSHPERDLYAAFAARVRGDREEFEDRVDRGYAGLGQQRDESVPSWVQDELLLLVSIVRLERRAREAEAKLQTALDNHYRALGGLEVVASLRSYVALGKVSVSGQEFPFRLLRKSPALYRLDLATPAGVVIEAADSQSAWRADPAVDGGRPSYLDGPRSAALRRGAHLFGPLVRYHLTGEDLLYKGVEEVGGREHHVIEVSAAGGIRELIYLDRKSHLETQRVVLGEKGEVVTTIRTELQQIEGYYLPAREIIESASGRTVEFVFEDYAVSAEIDNVLFDISIAYPSETE